MMTLLALVLAAFVGVLLHTQAQISNDRTTTPIFTLRGNIILSYGQYHRYEHNTIIILATCLC